MKWLLRNIAIGLATIIVLLILFFASSTHDVKQVWESPEIIGLKTREKIPEFKNDCQYLNASSGAEKCIIEKFVGSLLKEENAAITTQAMDMDIVCANDTISPYGFCLADELNKLLEKLQPLCSKVTDNAFALEECKVLIKDKLADQLANDPKLDNKWHRFSQFFFKGKVRFYGPDTIFGCIVGAGILLLVTGVLYLYSDD